MPWKLIFFVIIIVFVALFVGANHANVCNISLIFTEFQQVPVYFTILVSFIVGMIIMLPFTIGKRRGKSARQKKNDEPEFPVKEEYPAENSRNRKNRKRQEEAARKAGNNARNNSKANSPVIAPQPAPVASIEIPAITDGTSADKTVKPETSSSAKNSSGGKGFFGLFSKKSKASPESTDNASSTSNSGSPAQDTSADKETKPEENK